MEREDKENLLNSDAAFNASAFAAMPPPPPQPQTRKRIAPQQLAVAAPRLQSSVTANKKARGDGTGGRDAVTTHVYLCLDRSGSMRNKDVTGAGASGMSRYDAVFHAASELVEIQGREHGEAVNFSLILFNDDATMVLRNMSASDTISRLSVSKLQNPPHGGTNFSKPFRLLRGTIRSGETSVVVFLSDGRPGDLRANPPRRGEAVQSTYRSHGQTYDSAGIHLSRLSAQIRTGGLHFVGIHASGYPWLQWLAGKYNGSFHPASLDFGMFRSGQENPGPQGGPAAAESADDEGQENHGQRVPAAAKSDNNGGSDDEDEIELVGVVSTERRIQMNIANAKVISISSQTQTSSIRETFASLSQSITTFHDSASQRARKERRVVVKAESSSGAEPVENRFTATKLILSDGKFEENPTSKDIVVWLSSNPFAQGGERNVYRMREDAPLGQTTLTGFLSQREVTTKYPSVAKESRRELPYKERLLFHKQQIACQERSQKIADPFNSSDDRVVLKEDKIRFIRCDLLRMNDAQAGSGSYRYLSVEEALDGGDKSTAKHSYLKYNGNNGYVLDDTGEDDRVKRSSEIAQAFSHFSYVHTGGKEIVVDIQGCCLKLTDPQIHSVGRKYGSGDRGEHGFRDFFASHKCGQTCKELHLPKSHSL